MAKDVKSIKTKVTGYQALLAQQGRDIQQYKDAMKASSPGLAAYETAKAKFKTLNAELEKTKSLLDAAQLELSTASNKDKTTSSAAKLEAQAKKKESEAKYYEDINQPAKAKQLRDEAKDLRLKITNPSASTPTGMTGTGPLPTDEEMVQNEFAKAGVSADGTVQYGFPNPKGEGTTAGAAYIFVEPGKKGGTAYDGSTLRQTPDQDKSFAFGSTDEVLNKYYSQLVKQYGSKSALAQKLQEAGRLSNAKNADRAKILGALDKVVATYTADNTIAIKNGEIKELPTMDEYLSGLRGKGGGNSFTTSRTEISSETEAVRYLNQVSQSLTGKNYPREKLAEGIKILQQMQKKNPSMTTTSRNDEGDTTSSVTKNGLDTQGFLIQQIAQTDAAKEKQVLDYYQVFKNSFGVR